VSLLFKNVTLLFVFLIAYFRVHGLDQFLTSLRSVAKSR